MTTDITELAQREKFEAWAEQACAAPWGYLKKRRTTEGYSEQIYTCMWTAWKAAGAELVEALDKSEKTSEARREAIDRAHNMFVRERDRANAAEKRIAETESFGVAPGILRCTECSFVQTKNIISITADTILIGNSKPETCPNGCGSLQPVTWKALAIHLMFTTKQGLSDLLEAKKRIAELESRTVTLKLPDLRQVVSGDRYVWSDGVFNYSQDVKAELTAKGIKWEAE